jgi:hypothetical protein
MRWFCIVFGIVSLFHAEAQRPQGTPVPLPPGPLLARAPDYSKWVVSVTSGTTGDTSQPPNQTTKYDHRTLVEKSGAIRYEVTVSADGSKLEKWRSGNYQATIYPGVENPSIELQGVNGNHGGFTDYSKSDFVGFEWISRDNYIGVQTMEGIPCYVFHDGPSGIASSNPNAPVTLPQTGSTAYIEADNHKPILLQVDTVTNYYQWEQPPSTPLTLPPNVQAGFERIQAPIQQAALPQAAP